MSKVLAQGSLAWLPTAKLVDDPAVVFEADDFYLKSSDDRPGKGKGGGNGGGNGGGGNEGQRAEASYAGKPLLM